MDKLTINPYLDGASLCEPHLEVSGRVPVGGQLLYLTDCAVGLVRWVWERVNRR